MRYAGVNVVEAIGGGIIFLLGAYLVVQGLHYSIGTVTRMGPGFFPVCVGAILVVLGIAVAIEGRALNTAFPKFNARAFIGIVGGMIAWALLAEPYGLLPSTVALVALAGLAEVPYRPLPVILTTIILSVGGWLLFIVGLHLPLSVIKW
jgi:hypothetical protein